MRLAQFWLALLNLGSFRSPFVPDAYAAMGTIWLVTLLVTGRSEERRGPDMRKHVPPAPLRELGWRSLTLLLAIVPLSLIVDGFIATNPPAWIAAITLANQLLMLGINVWVVGRELLRPRLSFAQSPLPAPAV